MQRYKGKQILSQIFVSNELITRSHPSDKALTTCLGLPDVSSSQAIWSNSAPDGEQSLFSLQVLRPVYLREYSGGEGVWRAEFVWFLPWVRNGFLKSQSVCVLYLEDTVLYPLSTTHHIFYSEMCVGKNIKVWKSGMNSDSDGEAPFILPEEGHFGIIALHMHIAANSLKEWTCFLLCVPRVKVKLHFALSFHMKTVTDHLACRSKVVILAYMHEISTNRNTCHSCSCQPGTFILKSTLD